MIAVSAMFSVFGNQLSIFTEFSLIAMQLIATLSTDC